MAEVLAFVERQIDPGTRSSHSIILRISSVHVGIPWVSTLTHSHALSMILVYILRYVIEQ